ncbi:MAG: orotidine-5'-phosphate decarboxylase [Myxococcales bacterium]|nr:orotidine-5'-phosphate decarboxylase [Myxococcales bacterium]
MPAPRAGFGPALPRLAIALDAPALEPLEPVLDALHGLPILVKVGLSLFTAVGPSVVHHMRLAGFEVFLDLKLHDIPHQVGLAVDSIARLDVALVTVHAAGGRAMLDAALRAARGRTRVVGVTVLTSLERDDLAADGYDGPVASLVARRLELCARAGLDGAVLSALELPLAAHLPAAFVRVVPGIRSAGDRQGNDDQARIATAAHAAAAGADLLVVGRPVTRSPDPRAAASALLAEIAQAAAPGPHPLEGMS